MWSNFVVAIFCLHTVFTQLKTKTFLNFFCFLAGTAKKWVIWDWDWDFKLVHRICLLHETVFQYGEIAFGSCLIASRRSIIIFPMFKKFETRDFYLFYQAMLWESEIILINFHSISIGTSTFFTIHTTIFRRYLWILVVMISKNSDI